MLYADTLTLHLLGAGVTGMLAILTLIVLIRRDTSHYALSARLLMYTAALEVTTGIVLAIISSRISVLSLCDNIAIYLLAVFALLTVLYLRMRGTNALYPRLSLSPLAGALAAFLGAGALGF